MIRIKNDEKEKELAIDENTTRKRDHGTVKEYNPIRLNIVDVCYHDERMYGFRNRKDESEINSYPDTDTESEIKYQDLFLVFSNALKTSIISFSIFKDSRYRFPHSVHTRSSLFRSYDEVILIMNLKYDSFRQIKQGVDIILSWGFVFWDINTSSLVVAFRHRILH